MTALLATERPTILAVLACEDHGPCDPEPTACCPHCGADGRYIYTCLMSDGHRKGMMSGCLKTFRSDPCAKTCQLALEKDAHGKASAWDRRILAALESLKSEDCGIDQLRAVCRAVMLEKKAWMQRKGWARR